MAPDFREGVWATVAFSAIIQASFALAQKMRAYYFWLCLSGILS
jgi:hypothetical protein